MGSGNLVLLVDNLSRAKWSRVILFLSVGLEPTRKLILSQSCLPISARKDIIKDVIV